MPKIVSAFVGRKRFDELSDQPPELVHCAFRTFAEGVLVFELVALVPRIAVVLTATINGHRLP